MIFVIWICDFSDVEKPQIEERPDLVHFISSQQEYAYINWEEPLVTDNSEVYTTWSSHPPGRLFQRGSTVVVYTAEDSSGNRATMSFQVLVEGKVDIYVKNP